MLARMWRKGNSDVLFWGIQIGTHIRGNTLEVSQEKKILKMKLPYVVAIPLLGIYQMKWMTLSSMYVCVYCSTTRARICHQLTCSSPGERIKKKYISIIERYSAITKHEILSFMTNMDRLGQYSMKWNISIPEDKYHLISLTWKLKRCSSRHWK